MRPAPLLALAALLAACARAQYNSNNQWCSGDPAKINLGGDTINTTAAASAADCCAACMATDDYKCMG